MVQVVSTPSIRCLVFATVLISMPAAVLAADPPPWAADGGPAAARPLAELLDPDGTLDLESGFSGSLDPSGWRMEIEDGGAPVFLRSGEAGRAPANTWNALGPGLNDVVFAVAAAGADVYVGGDFVNAGGDPFADGIARWDGTSWHALGPGLTGEVHTIEVAGVEVYAGGVLLNVGGNPGVDGIARWDGSSWHALGPGLNGTVDAIAAVGPDLFVGGAFTDAGGNPDADYIARWDGSGWHPVGSGPSGWVRSLAVSGGDVYVGGEFTDTGGNPSGDHLAWWGGEAALFADGFESGGTGAWSSTAP
jgi:hypothetical protein